MNRPLSLLNNIGRTGVTNVHFKWVNVIWLNEQVNVEDCFFTRIHLRNEQLLTTIDCHLNELRTSIIHLYEDTRESKKKVYAIPLYFNMNRKKKAILFISYIWRCIWPSWLNSNFIISQFAEVKLWTFFFVM